MAAKYLQVLNMKSFIEKYDSWKSNYVSVVLQKVCPLLNVHQETSIKNDLVNQRITNGHESKKNNLSIVRRIERSYPIKNSSEMNLTCDELYIQSADQKCLDKFIKNLSKELSSEEGGFVL